MYGDSGSISQSLSYDKVSHEKQVFIAQYVFLLHTRAGHRDLLYDTIERLNAVFRDIESFGRLEFNSDDDRRAFHSRCGDELSSIMDTFIKYVLYSCNEYLENKLDHRVIDKILSKISSLSIFVKTEYLYDIIKCRLTDMLLGYAVYDFTMNLDLPRTLIQISEVLQHTLTTLSKEPLPRTNRPYDLIVYFLNIFPMYADIAFFHRLLYTLSHRRDRLFELLELDPSGDPLIDPSQHIVPAVRSASHGVAETAAARTLREIKSAFGIHSTASNEDLPSAMRDYIQKLNDRNRALIEEKSELAAKISEFTRSIRSTFGFSDDIDDAEILESINMKLYEMEAKALTATESEKRMKTSLEEERQRTGTRIEIFEKQLSVRDEHIRSLLELIKKTYESMRILPGEKVEDWCNMLPRVVKQEIEERQERLASARREIEELASRLRTMREDFLDCDESKRRIDDESRAEVTLLSKKCADLEKRLAACEQSREKLWDEYQALERSKSENDGAKEDLHKTVAELRSRERMYAERDREVETEIAEMNSRHRIEVEKLKKELYVSKNNEKRMSEQLSDAEKSETFLRRENEHYKSQLLLYVHPRDEYEGDDGTGDHGSSVRMRTMEASNFVDLETPVATTDADHDDDDGECNIVMSPTRDGSKEVRRASVSYKRKKSSKGFDAKRRKRKKYSNEDGDAASTETATVATIETDDADRPRVKKKSASKARRTTPTPSNHRYQLREKK